MNNSRTKSTKSSSTSHRKRSTADLQTRGWGEGGGGEQLQQTSTIKKMHFIKQTMATLTRLRTKIKKSVLHIIFTHHSFLTLFRMSFFGAAQGAAKNAPLPLPKICHTYPTMMKLGTNVPYLKKIQKIYESRDTPLEFC